MTLLRSGNRDRVEALFQKMADDPGDDYTVRLKQWHKDGSATVEVLGYTMSVVGSAKLSFTDGASRGSYDLVKVQALGKAGRPTGHEIWMTPVPSAVMAVILR